MKTSSVDKDFDTCGRELMFSELVGNDTDFAADIETANIINSRCKDDPKSHRLVLDLDFPARLIPSSHEGRFHLYLDGVTLTHDKFELLIKALAECGIIGQDYAKYSLDRGYTSVRLPWIKKSEDDTDSE